MNWTSIILDLQNRGFTQTEIAALCGVSQASISDLATGKTRDPSYLLGETLLRVHRRKCKPKPAAAPASIGSAATENVA
jgi:predicted transcriptional regulator